MYGINLLLRKAGGSTFTYMYNGHADVTALLDTDGNLVATYYYDAFGNILEKTGTADNSILYGGYQYDEETGLYYLNARMYDPVTARFLQKDTYRGQYNDPLSLNLYTYCHNEPLMSDPTGHVILKQGSKGDDVKALQRALNAELGLSLEVDGKYGPKTAAAVVAYQKKNDLKVDGIAGDQTKGSLGIVTDRQIKELESVGLSYSYATDTISVKDLAKFTGNNTYAVVLGVSNIPGVANATNNQPSEYDQKTASGFYWQEFMTQYNYGATTYYGHPIFDDYAFYLREANKLKENFVSFEKFVNKAGAIYESEEDNETWEDKGNKIVAAATAILITIAIIETAGMASPLLAADASVMYNVEAKEIATALESEGNLTLGVETNAANQLARYEAQTANAHFLSRHGAATTLEQQFIRATTGLTPDGIAGKVADSSRFLSNQMQLNAAQRAEIIF